ncbi:uncharacterized protein PAC_16259 [Phialocephala subalpina]|uniref:Clr5 domain-containing protein n=1 Tax=Phialocephala subalpina TaxID=576137 RepID=A0A1L7XMW2_9HELO|nr:uncharacterized protein PAC_16259 [Phialocephala subalpina]
MASEWESRKERITELFSDRNNTLDRVMAIMKCEGFSASKSGYERQLKAWGIRKNRDKTSMISLKIKLEQRQRRNKNSHVYIKGVLLSKLDIEQATAGCYVSYAAPYAPEECKTPPGMTVITPTSDGYMLSVRTRDLPFIYFLRQLAPITNLNMLIDMPPQILQAIVPAICTEPNLGQLAMENIFHHLSATLPVQRDDDILPVLRHIVGHDFTAATLEILKVTVYLLSNNLLDNGDLICDELLKWFQMGDNHLLLAAILSHKMPTIEAFAEGIFASALQAEDQRMVRVFLDSGMNPGIVIRVSSSPSGFGCTALQLAAGKNNLDLVKLFLEFDIDVDQTGGGMSDYGSRTPLQIAARNGNMELAQILISRGAVLDKLDLWGAAALQNAASKGNIEIAKTLLDHGADINVQSRTCGCALECAIRVRDTAMFEMLLQRGANVNGTEPSVNTPLQSAAMVDDHETVQHLLQQGADANAPAPRWKDGYRLVENLVREHDRRTALQWAAANGNTKLCQILMDAGANLNAVPGKVNLDYGKHMGMGMTVLAAAVLSKNYELVELLLRCGADINDERGSETALEAATRLDDMAIVQLVLSAHPRLGNSLVSAVRNQNLRLILMLLEAGADINAVNECGESALSVAVSVRDHSLVSFLLQSGANPAPKSAILPLVVAAYVGDLDLIKILLDGGANCDQRGRRRRNAGLIGDLNVLQAAAITGNINIVRYLLEVGADLNVPAAQYEGRTALQAAVQSGSSETVQLLLNWGARVNSPAGQSGGVTALQAAVLRRDIGLVRMLLTAGADANDMPAALFGKTSLQTASEKGDDKIVCLLLEYGADINSPAADIYGRTALQAAAEVGHYYMVQLLLARGADANAPACNDWGLTAIQAAARGGYLHIADVLLKNGANVNAPASERRGYTALETAAHFGRVDMLKLLLNAGADITSEFGRAQLKSAMVLATSSGHESAAKLLKYHQIC